MGKRMRLASARKAAGYTQEGLAEALRVDRSAVFRWEAGKSEPLPYQQPKLARLLGISTRQLDELLHDAAEVPADTRQPHDRVAHALQHPGSVDLTTVAQLRQDVHGLDERYDRAPSTSLLAETGQCLGQVGFLRSHATANRVRRELFAVEAECATLMGQLVWDASQRRDHATARGYFDQAIHAAKQMHDPAAEGLALLRKSFVALYGEKNAEAGLSLTRQTAATTKTTSHVLTGLAVLHAAEAHAMLGQQAECEQALEDAEHHFERISEIDAAFELYSPTQHGRLAGSCYLFLNKAKQAQPILEATARGLRDRSKSQAIVLGNLSLAHLRQGELDGAATVLHQAVDVVEQTWGGGGLNIVFGACRELQPWRNEVVVQDVYDRVMALLATT